MRSLINFHLYFAQTKGNTIGWKMTFRKSTLNFRGKCRDTTKPMLCRRSLNSLRKRKPAKKENRFLLRWEITAFCVVVHLMSHLSNFLSRQNAVSLPADVLWGLSRIHKRDKRTPKDVCSEAKMLFVQWIFLPLTGRLCPGRLSFDWAIVILPLITYLEVVTRAWISAVIVSGRHDLPSDARAFSNDLFLKRKALHCGQIRLLVCLLGCCLFC